MKTCIRRETVELATNYNGLDIFFICITIIHFNCQPNKVNDGKVNDGKGYSPYGL